MSSKSIYEEAIDWKTIFDKYDNDRNGHIDSTEFTFLVKDLLFVRDNKVFTFEDSVSVARRIAQHSAWTTNGNDDDYGGGGGGVSSLITLDKFILGCTNGFLQTEYQITPKHFHALIVGDLKGTLSTQLIYGSLLISLTDEITIIIIIIHHHHHLYYLQYHHHTSSPSLLSLLSSSSSL
jgi:hypothetical protein